MEHGCGWQMRNFPSAWTEKRHNNILSEGGDYVHGVYHYLCDPGGGAGAAHHAAGIADQAAAQNGQRPSRYRPHISHTAFRTAGKRTANGDGHVSAETGGLLQGVCSRADTGAEILPQMRY